MASAPDSHQDQDETNAGKPLSFSELARLARESKSSWDGAVPGRKADKQFLLAIFIAIVVVSGLTLISGYQEQLSVKLDAFTADFSDKNNPPALTEPALDESEPGGASNPLLAKITRLDNRIAALQAQIIELNAAVAELEATALAASAISTESISALDQESASLTPKPPPEPKPEPKPKPKPKPRLSEPVIETPTIAEPVTKRSAPVTVTAPISKEIGAPANLVPASIAPVNGAPANTAPVNTVSLAGRPWIINIGAFSNSTSAAKLLSEARGVVANAEIQDIRVKNQTLYRVRAFGYVSRDEAKRDAERLQSKLGLSVTWINEEK